MPYLIFKSLTSAEAYVKDVERAQGIPRPGTDSWDEPLKSASKRLWAVVESFGYPVQRPETAVDVLDELPSSWWEKP